MVNHPHHFLAVQIPLEEMVLALGQIQKYLYEERQVHVFHMQSLSVEHVEVLGSFWFFSLP